MATTPTIPASFFESVLSLPPTEQLRWYSCVIVSLSSLNYPDVIPQVYEHLDTHFLSNLSHDDRFDAARRLREALIKSTGIVGAARTGNAIRTLTGLIPEDLRETKSPRSQESDEVARARGKTFWTRVYERNKAFDPQATVRASPDYAFVVREVLYGRIFSFNVVIDDLTTGYVMVSALYGMDCPNQLQHHMKGMLVNGASREDLIWLQELCLGLAKFLGVTFRHGPAPIPTSPNMKSTIQHRWPFISGKALTEVRPEAWLGFLLSCEDKHSVKQRDVRRNRFSRLTAVFTDFYKPIACIKPCQEAGSQTPLDSSIRQLWMQKQVVNSVIEGSVAASQRLATVFDGLTRNSPEGIGFQQLATRRGFKDAVHARDEPGRTEEYRKRWKSSL